MATVWTYGGYLCHASKATSFKQDKVGDANTNQKFYETNSRIIQLNKELRKTLEAVTKLRTHCDYYVSMVREKNAKARAAVQYTSGETVTNNEAKRIALMSNDELKRYSKINYNSKDTGKQVERGPINSIAKILDTMKDEYESAYKKYQNIATLSLKLSAIEPVSKTAAAFSYEIMNDIYEIVYNTMDNGIAEISAELPSSDSRPKTLRNWLSRIPRPDAL